MTGWTTPAQVKEKVQKDWDKGTLMVASWANQPDALPYRVNLKGPTSAQWSDEFDAARRWIAQWDGFPVEWREFTHPRLGKNRVPVAVEYSTWDELFALIGKRTAADRFRRAADEVTTRYPALGPWVLTHSTVVLDRADNWPRLLAVVDWMERHPRPGVYLRQMDVPGVHTKFVEAHRSLLTTLLDLVLPPSAIDAERRGAAQFAERYGFRSRPRLVRFRPLGSATAGPRDITWTVDDWARWNEPPRRVFITENEVNFLAFPEVAGAIVVFGAGYGFEGWDDVAWLRDAEAFYWGDLDTHGFAILDRLRTRLPQVRSFLMDEATLVAHQSLWGEEPDPTDRALPRLTDAEQAVYQGLVTDRWAPRLRLEQERISYGWVGHHVPGL